MHVVVVGCGRVGAALTQEISGLGHTVAVIDKRETAFRRLPPDFAGRRIHGFGFDRDRLREAGIEEASAVAAVTSGDNSNIMVARIARETFGIERVVARIYDPGRATIYQRLGIPTVATVAWTTDQAMRRLLPSETRTEWADSTGAVVLVERMLPDVWVGKPLAKLGETGKWRVVAVTRTGEAMIPTHSLIGQEGDMLLVVVTTDSLPGFELRMAGDAGQGGGH
ncbi:MAG: TrkA family potassium uptake protein [Actinobacteria bacterium]|nr:TrkA family potassium uptake protein [Actinomycetota bacterium]